MFGCLFGWLTDWLTGWLIDWLIVWLIGWLIDWFVDWLVAWLAEFIIAASLETKFAQIKRKNDTRHKHIETYRNISKIKAKINTPWYEPEVRAILFMEYKPVLPSDGFGEWGRSDAMLGCRDGARTDILEPRRSWPCSSLLSRSRETFIRRGFGVLKMVRFSRQRALRERKQKHFSLIHYKWSSSSSLLAWGYNMVDVCQSRACLNGWMGECEIEGDRERGCTQGCGHVQVAPSSVYVAN